MRICPKLILHFADTRYRAETLDMEQMDRRLKKVRVRFKVFDEIEKKWVKQRVQIISFSLSSELN